MLLAVILLITTALSACVSPAPSATDTDLSTPSATESPSPSPGAQSENTPLKQAESILNRWEKQLNANSYEIQLSRPSIKASILYDSNISNANVTSAAQIEYLYGSFPNRIDVFYYNDSQMTTMRRDYGDSSEDITYCGGVTSRCNIEAWTANTTCGTYTLFKAITTKEQLADLIENKIVKLSDFFDTFATLLIHTEDYLAITGADPAPFENINLLSVVLELNEENDYFEFYVKEAVSKEHRDPQFLCSIKGYAEKHNIKPVFDSPETIVSDIYSSMLENKCISIDMNQEIYYEMFSNDTQKFNSIRANMYLFNNNSKSINMLASFTSSDYGFRQAEDYYYDGEYMYFTKSYYGNNTIPAQTKFKCSMDDFIKYKSALDIPCTLLKNITPESCDMITISYDTLSYHDSYAYISSFDAFYNLRIALTVDKYIKLTGCSPEDAPFDIVYITLFLDSNRAPISVKMDYKYYISDKLKQDHLTLQFDYHNKNNELIIPDIQSYKDGDIKDMYPLSAAEYIKNLSELFTSEKNLLINTVFKDSTSSKNTTTMLIDRFSPNKQMLIENYNQDAYPPNSLIQYFKDGYKYSSLFNVIDNNKIQKDKYKTAFDADELFNSISSPALNLISNKEFQSILFKQYPISIQYGGTSHIYVDLTPEDFFKFTGSDTSNYIDNCSYVTVDIQMLYQNILIMEFKFNHKEYSYKTTSLTTTLANADLSFEATLKLMGEYENFPERNDAE